jgi:2-polyprenyl-3-methyl-5-hydroxy-6-metoxy-1,4-benzoquinol methylase
MIYQNRRQLLTASVATMAASGMLAGKGAHAAPKIDIEPRGQKGIFERLPDLNLESYHDFLRGVRQWSNFYGLVNASRARTDELMKEQGLDDDQIGKLTFAQLMPMLDKDPTINLYGRAWLDGQWYKFKTLQDAFHARADQYFDEMEYNDNIGPGKLELNPTMHIPDYTKHEIHTQLGGYVGDPFAGYIYLYDVLILNDGRNEQDINHIATANRVPIPKDGKVKRILDYGTGVGQLATSLKARFPEAEVWGIDVGGPMVRYAHLRANDMNNGANFRQALAEDTGFPDNYFDIVTTNIVHHEVTAEASKQIFKESQRVMRPGGVYYPVDLYTNGAPGKEAWRKVLDYLTLRWNHEDWWMEWQELDRVAEMRKAGMIVSENGPGSAMGGMTDPTSKNIVATKA